MDRLIPLDLAPDDVRVKVPRCRCGADATANGRECPRCFRDRLCTVNNGFTPTRTAGVAQIDPARSRRWDSRLEDYRRTRAEGSQPRGTRRHQVEEAKRISDLTQRPFDAGSFAAEAVA